MTNETVDLNHRIYYVTVDENDVSTVQSLFDDEQKAICTAHRLAMKISASQGVNVRVDYCHGGKYHFDYFKNGDQFALDPVKIPRFDVSISILSKILNFDYSE